MSRIFIGGLPEDATRTELEREFEHIGRMRDIWVARNPPGFGFIIFEDPRDADDAVRDMDGKRVCGTKVRVEKARGPSNGRGRGGGRSEKCYNCGKVGHISRECRSARGGGGGGGGGYGGGGGGGGYGGRRRSRSKSRSHERSSRRQRSRSPSQSKSKSRDQTQRSRSRSRDQSRDRKRSVSDDRQSPVKDKRSRSRSRSNHSDRGNNREHSDDEH